MNINIINNSVFIKKVPRRKINLLIQKIIQDERKNKQNILFQKFIKKIDYNNIEINILFVDKKDIIFYNKKYFNRHQPTDVIAFSAIEGQLIDNNNVLGEAIICCEIASENSQIYNYLFLEEIYLLIIHSILHILSYDHNDQTDPDSVMRQKEKFYFDLIKENNVF